MLGRQVNNHLTIVNHQSGIGTFCICQPATGHLLLRLCSRLSRHGGLRWIHRQQFWGQRLQGRTFHAVGFLQPPLLIVSIMSLCIFLQCQQDPPIMSIIVHVTTVHRHACVHYCHKLHGFGLFWITMHHFTLPGILWHTVLYHDSTTMQYHYSNCSLTKWC